MRLDFKHSYIYCFDFPAGIIAKEGLESVIFVEEEHP